MNTFEEKLNKIEMSLQLCKNEINSIYGWPGSVNDILRKTEDLYHSYNKLKMEKYKLLIIHERKQKLVKINEVRLNFK